jgi:cell division protein FtsA
MNPEEKQEIIEITPVGRNETRLLSKEILCDIMQPRAVELLHHLADEIQRAGGQISSGVILTGGSSLIRGTTEIAEQVFDAPTRLGFPERSRFGALVDEIESPEWAVVCGLAFASMRLQMREHHFGIKSPTQRVARWFENFREKFR